MDVRDVSCESHTTTKEGEELAQLVKAVNYVECSALTRENIKDVFDGAVRAVLEKKKNEKKGFFGRFF